MATYIKEPNSNCILLENANAKLEECQGLIEHFVDGNEMRQSLGEQIGKQLDHVNKANILGGGQMGQQLNNEEMLHTLGRRKNIRQSLTLNILNDSFNQIFCELNSRFNSYTQTVEILSRHIDLLRDTIKLFRNSDEDIRFHPNIHKIDTRYLKDLDKKKISKYLVPAQCLGDGNCLFRAACQAQFGHQNFHMPLRICCVFVLITHLEYFEKHSTWNSKRMKNHITNMARDTVWGEEDEQMALSFIFRKPIVVLSALHSLEYNSLLSERDPLVFYFDANPAAGHFTSILLKENVAFYFDVIRPEYTVIEENMIDQI